MIALLLPTRGRPDNLRRLHQSVLDTATNQPIFSVYVDDDDPESATVARELEMVVTSGPRILLSQCWNEAYKAVSADIYMHCGDDLIFRTRGWDEQVEAAFAACPDKILFVHGNDLSGNAHNGGTHGFLHRTWPELIGYFVPPRFSSDYNDTWLNYVADALSRRLYLPELVTEHMHPSFGKAELDLTHQERLERGRRDDVVTIWERSKPERDLDVESLRDYIRVFSRTIG